MAPLDRFLRAAAENDTVTLNTLLEQDPSLARAHGPHPYWGGEPTALHCAVEWCCEDAARVLLEGGADPNDPGAAYGGWSPLHVAVIRGRRRGCPSIARLLIQQGAAVDIFSAVGLGMVDRVKMLLDNGLANPHLRGPGGVSPLHWAANVETARLLIDRGAHLDAADQHGNFPERSAAALHAGVARFLLAERGVLPDLHLAAALDHAGRVVDLLEWDATRIMSQAVRWDAVAAFSGGTPLHIAALHDQGEVARVLIGRGAGVNAGCLDGVSPLHYTAWNGSVSTAEILLDHGTDVNAIEPNHRATPLGWATFQRWPKLVELLRSRSGKLATEL